ncbi:MAG TPA: hypothetical protein VGD81_17950 [Opitutaceae bacterium]
MNDSSPIVSFPGLVRWLAARACFPASRLPAPAELLLLVNVAAAQEEAAEAAAAGGPRFSGQRVDPSQTAALKAHALRRSRVHFKCDNSAKV